MDTVIEVEGLRKEYRRVRGRRTVAVDGLDLAVPPGGVFGFLGPNGAGKTTTIRCLLGLVRPTGGRCRLLGQEPAGLHKVIGRVGSIVESPAMYPRFSARRNLELLGRISGVGRTRVREVLEETGFVVADRIAATGVRYEILRESYSDRNEWERLYGPNVLVVPEEVYVAEVPLATDPTLAPYEHDDFRWCNLEEALELLKWDTNREALVVAHDFIRARKPTRRSAP